MNAMREFLYSLDEEYFALAVADASSAPEEIQFDFYWEKFDSPLMDFRDIVDRDVWVVGDFLPFEEAFPEISVDERVEQWEREAGERWDEGKVFRAFKIRLDVFFSQEYEADLSPEEVGESLNVDYSFGSVEELRLDWSISCYAGSIEELELCKDRKFEAL